MSMILITFAVGIQDSGCCHELQGYTKEKQPALTSKLLSNVEL